jgi:hypothetical protein
MMVQMNLIVLTPISSGVIVIKMADCTFPTIFAAFELIFSSDVTPVELMPCCLLCFKSLEHLL